MSKDLHRHGQKVHVHIGVPPQVNAGEKERDFVTFPAILRLSGIFLSCRYSERESMGKAEERVCGKGEKGKREGDGEEGGERKGEIFLALASPIQ